MKQPLIILLLFVAQQFAASLFAADPGLGGTNVLGTNAMHEARIQATNSLVTFKALITPGNSVVLGFSSTNEASLATNGEPILVYPVRFEKLKTYQLGQDLAELLGPVDRVIFPVLATNHVRSSLTLRLIQTQTMWTNENWGQPRLIRDLTQTLAAIPAAEISPDSIPFAVQIPVFNMWFVGHRNVAQQIVFRATVLLPLGPQRGDIIPDATMAELSVKAKEYPGPP